MATKGYLDYGYDESRDSIYNFDDVGKVIDGSFLNINNSLYENNYPLHFIGFAGLNKPRLNYLSSGDEGDVGKILLPGSPGDNFVNNAPNIEGINVCENNKYTIDPDNDSVHIRFGQQSNPPNGCHFGFNTQLPPRTYKISRRVAIQVGHYQPHYFQCGEMTNAGTIPYEVSFYDEANAYSPEIQARHGGLGSAGGRYTSFRSGQPSACGVPDSVPDVASPNDFVVAMTNADLSIYIFKEDIPDTIPTLHLIDPSWIDLYMNEDDNPDTAQATRLCYIIDQNLRPMLSTLRFSKGSGDGIINTTRYQFTDETFESYEFIDLQVDTDGVHNAHNFNLDAFKSNINIPYSSFFKTTYGNRNSFFNLTRNVIPADATLPQITLDFDSYVPTDKVLSNVDYDFRDSATRTTTFDPITGGYADLHVGDSGLCVILPLEDGSFGLVAIKGTGGSGVQPWYNWGFKEGLNYLLDSYGIATDDRPKYVTPQTNPFEEYTTPLSSRPSLGYKVYKSAVSENGPWYDITSQIFANNSDYHDSDDTGYRCVDNTVPCYTVHETFIDEYVSPNQTYYYYVTAVDDDGAGGYTESPASNVCFVNTPSDSQWTDERKLFVSNLNSSTNVTVTASPPNQIGFNIPSSLNRSTEHVVAEGWRGGDYENSIPFFGNVGVPPEGGIFPRPKFSSTPVFYRVDGGNANNSGIHESPMPIESTSYPYVLGLPYSEFDPILQNNSNNVLKMFAYNENDMNNFRNNAKILNFTKYNDNDKFQPYYHSNIAPAFTTFRNIETFRMNPAGYGNFRVEYNENWSFSNTGQISGNYASYIGYHVGNYLSSDIAGARFLKTLELKDSAISANFDKLEYLNLPTLNNLEVLNLENNELYSIAFDGTNIVPNTIKDLNLSNNNLGSSSSAIGGKWLDDTNVPNANPQNFIVVKSPNIEKVNITNNPDFRLTSTDILSELREVRASNSKGILGNLNAPKLEKIILEDTYAPTLQLSKTSLLKTIDMKGSQIESIRVVDQDICSGLGSLRTIDVSNSSIKSLNLKFRNGDVDAWSDRFDGTIGRPSTIEDGVQDPSVFGSFAGNIKHIYARNSTLNRLYLPPHNQAPQLTCETIEGFGDPTRDDELELLDISGTQLGISGTLDYFFSQQAFSPEGYPSDKTFTVSANSIRDESGNISTLSLQRYNEILESWDRANKNIVLNVDIA